MNKKYSIFSGKIIVLTYGKMNYSSLHLSDLDQSLNYRILKTPDKTRTVSNFSGNDLYQSTILLDQKKTAKVKLYETKIQNFERKFKEEKRKAVFSVKESLNHLKEEETKIEKNFIQLQQDQVLIKQRKEQSDKLISEQKLILLELEDESKRLEKSDKWANSTFSFKKSSNYMTDSVLQMKSQLSQVKNHIKDSRSKIFHYQKELLRISEALSPVRTQQYILRSRIEESQNPTNNDSTVRVELQQKVRNSFNGQLLAFKKAKAEKNIKDMLLKIDVVQNEKNKVMEKLLVLRSSVNESLLKSIQDQVNQYSEALSRRKKLEMEKLNSTHSAISKELDIQIERDAIKEERNEILKQKEEIQNKLKEKNEQILRLEKLINADDIVTSGPEGVLDELISKIQSARLESLKLDNAYSIFKQTTENSEIELDQTELNNERNNIDKNIKSVISEINESKDQIQRLNIDVEKENSTVSKLSESISFMEIHKPVIQTPKINLYNERIASIEKSIEKLKKKKEKKRIKIQNLEDTLIQSIAQLDLRKNRNLFRADVMERLERSLKWLYQFIKSNTNVWREIRSVTMSTINMWDSNVLLAALNEAEDLYIRNSVIYY